jgi:hypothetical protein
MRIAIARLTLERVGEVREANWSIALRWVQAPLNVRFYKYATPWLG